MGGLPWDHTASEWQTWDPSHSRSLQCSETPNGRERDRGTVSAPRASPPLAQSLAPVLADILQARASSQDTHFSTGTARGKEMGSLCPHPQLLGVCLGRLGPERPLRLYILRLKPTMHTAGSKCTELISLAGGLPFSRSAPTHQAPATCQALDLCPKLTVGIDVWLVFSGRFSAMFGRGSPACLLQDWYGNQERH